MGKRAHLRNRIAGVVCQQRTHGTHFGVRFEKIGQAGDRFGGDSRVVVQAQNVFALDGAEADVQGFGETEVFGRRLYSDGGKFVVEVAGAIRRSVIDDDYLMSVAEPLEASAKAFDALQGNDYYRDALGCGASGTSGWGVKLSILL